MEEIVQGAASEQFSQQFSQGQNITGNQEGVFATPSRALIPISESGNSTPRDFSGENILKQAQIFEKGLSWPEPTNLALTLQAENEKMQRELSEQNLQADFWAGNQEISILRRGPAPVDLPTPPMASCQEISAVSGRGERPRHSSRGSVFSSRSDNSDEISPEIQLLAPPEEGRSSSTPCLRATGSQSSSSGQTQSFAWVEGTLPNFPLDNLRRLTVINSDFPSSIPPRG